MRARLLARACAGLAAAIGFGSTGEYTGALDGQLGTGGRQAYQRALRHDWGYTGANDGTVGSGTVMALQRQMRDAGWGYGGAVDGVAGPETRVAFQRFADACVSVCGQGAAV
ncbi:hypothetical protein ACSNOK_16045 [Streptomyces sp. URMC 126]|uniref:hypothetical protein n=1 Tax=Streptomyces sp. URMC 126 TaxID=3423401 RepID=UPI003F1C751C